MKNSPWKLILGSVAMFALLSSSVAMASRAENRQNRQTQRIREGVKSGELTRKETRRLMRGQKRVEKAREKAAADGVVTPKEKRKIERMQNRQSRKIYRNKHDGQKRIKGVGKGSHQPAEAIPLSPPANAQIDDPRAIL